MLRGQRNYLWTFSAQKIKETRLSNLLVRKLSCPKVQESIFSAQRPPLRSNSPVTNEVLLKKTVFKRSKGLWDHRGLSWRWGWSEERKNRWDKIHLDRKAYSTPLHHTKAVFQLQNHYAATYLPPVFFIQWLFPPWDKYLQLQIRARLQKKFEQHQRNTEF